MTIVYVALVVAVPVLVLLTGIGLCRAAARATRR
jgi:hypothetical protein